MDKEEEDMLMEMDAEEIGREAALNLVEEDNATQSAGSNRNSEFALANDLRPDIIFPDGFVFDMGDQESRRLVQMYKNKVELVRLGLETHDLRYLKDPGKPKKSMMKKNMSGKQVRPEVMQAAIRQQRSEQRALERDEARRERSAAAEDKRRQKVADRERKQQQAEERRLQKESISRPERVARARREDQQQKSELEKRYMDLPWARATVSSGRSPVQWDQVPVSLREDPRIQAGMEALRKGWEDSGKPTIDVLGQTSYRYVQLYRYSRSEGKFRGYQVQMTVVSGAPLRWIGTFSSSRLGALMYVAAEMSPDLRWSRSALDWIEWIVEGGDQNVQHWFENYVRKDVSFDRFLKHSGGGRPRKETEEQPSQALQQHGSLDDSFPDLPEAPDLRQLRIDGITVDHLVGLHPIRDILNAGYTIRDLRDARVPVNSLIDVVPVRDILDGGYSLQDLTATGISLSKLARANVSFLQMNDLGYSNEELKQAGFDVTYESLID